MADDNVELFRRGTDSLLETIRARRRDVDPGIIHPELVWEPLRSPVSGAYEGPEGMRQFLADTIESFDVFRLDYSDLRAVDDERVLAIGTMHFRARHGGVEMDVPTAGIATFRDGLLLRWKDYGDRRKALEAAGLAE
jgi:hypothetical protein